MTICTHVTSFSKLGNLASRLSSACISLIKFSGEITYKLGLSHTLSMMRRTFSVINSNTLLINCIPPSENCSGRLGIVLKNSPFLTGPLFALALLYARQLYSIFTYQSLERFAPNTLSGRVRLLQDLLTLSIQDKTSS